MQVRRLWRALSARWTLLVGGLLVGMIAAGGYLLIAPRAYTASARILVTSVPTELAPDGTFVDGRQLASYLPLGDSPAVLRPVMRALGLRGGVASLARRVSIEVAGTSSVLEISAADSRPGRAAAIADAVAVRLGDEIDRVSPIRIDGTSPVRVQVVQRAVASLWPSSPSFALILTVVPLGGLLAGLLLAVGLEAVTRPVRAPDDVFSVADAPVVGEIVEDATALRRPVADGGLRSEQYRRLAAVAEGMAATGGSRIVITSSVPSEGKSLVAVNLALELARSGSTVCLVDADLRSPSVARLIGVPDVTGLAAVVRDEMDVMSALTEPDRPAVVSVLPAGDAGGDSAEILHSDRARDALDQLDAAFDVVIVDSPDLLTSTDALDLARSSGGALLVAASGRVSTSRLRDSAALIGATGGALRGVVLNRVPRRSIDRRLRRAARESRPEAEEEEYTPRDLNPEPTD